MLIEIGLLAATATGIAEAPEIPFDSERWEVKAEEARVEEHLGRTSLFLKDGLATVKDLEFTDGILEFDIAFSEERGFMGGVWRLQDGENGEEFYLRPHQSGKPDACQYTPILHGVTSWQLYHGEGYGVPLKHLYDEWMTVRIVVSGNSAEIYVRDLDTPALVVGELKTPRATGRVGVNAYFAPAHFSRFRVLPGKVRLKGSPPTPPSTPEGTIREWEVSEAFSEEALEGMENRSTESDEKLETALEEAELLRWRPLEVEPGGLANLARLQGVSEKANTVIARTTLVSDGPRQPVLRFGYSDRIQVHLNGRLLYAGDNTYRSRDFRYLGTIGYFDAVILPLKEGENHLWMVVSESFGGWGVQARVENDAGVSVR